MASTGTTPGRAAKPPARKATSKTTASKLPPAGESPTKFADVIRRNVKLLKGLRNMSDQNITDRGGYTSRQVLFNRLSGEVDFSTEDICRIAAALDVEFHVLITEQQSAVIAWTEQHPDYVGPTYAPQEARGPRK